MFLPLYDSNRLAHVDFAYVNYTIIAVTVLAFLLQTAAGPEAAFNAQVGFGMIPVVVRDIVDAPMTWMPDQTGLVTYMFLHADWLHLITNMLFLWVFGDNIEDAMGHFKYLVFYILCGVLGALAHLVFNAESYSPLIGASGAVAGVLGAYIVLYPRVRVFVLNRFVIFFPLALPAWAILGFWIASQFFNVMVGSQDGVAWWAHLGGVVAGALLVIVFKRRQVALFGR